MSRPASDLRARLARVRLLVTDVDGVLTDGTLYYGAEGEATKAFHVRDGMGLRLLMEAGVEVAVISARSGEPLRRRLADLHVQRIMVGRDDKRSALAELVDEVGVELDAIAYVGDDTLDLPALAEAGVAIAVADAHADVRRAAHWVTRAGGGRGALREVADAILASRRGEVEPFKVVIPSRYDATRLPGKPLRELAGRPMVAHVWDRGVESGANEVLVATDDERVRAAVEAAGGKVEMTAATHASGTERLAEVATRLAWAEDVIVVNLQGDEPCMDPELIRLAARALTERPDAGIATLATPIVESRDLFDPNVVKVVLDDTGLARYFSRAPIPWVRGVFTTGSPPPERLPEGVRFLRHLGLYAYRAGVLRRLAAERARAEEQVESLEQLRALSMGIGVHVSVVANAPGHGVDTEADLARVERELAERGRG